jgi:hypothetical protein
MVDVTINSLKDNRRFVEVSSMKKMGKVLNESLRVKKNLQNEFDTLSQSLTSRNENFKNTLNMKYSMFLLFHGILTLKDSLNYLPMFSINEHFKNSSTTL